MREGRERVDAFLGDQDHAPTVATVATVGTAAGNVLLTAETHAATPTVSGGNLDLHTIYKHGTASHGVGRPMRPHPSREHAIEG